MLQKDQLSYRDIVTESEEAQEEEEQDEVEEEDDYSHEAARTRSVSLLGDEEGEEEDNESSTFLSLSEKPDRNTAWLDDYESDVLHFAIDTSGLRCVFLTFQLSYLHYCCFLFLLHRRPPMSTRLPSAALFRSNAARCGAAG